MAFVAGRKRIGSLHPRQLSAPKAGGEFGGGGIVAVGVGSYFGLRAFSRSADAKRLCSPSSCHDPNAVALNDEAKNAADIATVAIGVGVVALAVGAYFFLTSGSSKKTAHARSGIGLVIVGLE